MLFSPHHVPIPLCTKVKQNLDRMESMQVIAKVEEPTSWCTGMVVVTIKAGTIHICVDLKPLNKSIQNLM